MRERKEREREIQAKRQKDTEKYAQDKRGGKKYLQLFFLIKFELTM